MSLSPSTNVSDLAAISLTAARRRPRPSEGGLVERFKVSRTTVRKAIQNLVERGFVEVTRGKGTFVTQPRITRDARRSWGLSA
jgi:DNA-binding FadR family transcriptional regulator